MICIYIHIHTDYTYFIAILTVCLLVYSLILDRPPGGKRLPMW